LSFGNHAPFGGFEMVVRAACHADRWNVMTQPFEISIIIPTCNRRDMLAAAVESVATQHAQKIAYEIVVVDNGSVDGTRHFVQSLVNRSRPPVRYVLEERQGISYARNAGILAARSPLIAFLDDDCRAASDWVMTINQTFDRHSEVGCLGGKVLPVWKTKPPEWLDKGHWSPLAITDHGDTVLSVDADHPLCLVAANLAFRRDVFGRIGLFNTTLARSEDHELELRFFTAGGRALYVPTMIVTTDVPAGRCTKRYHRAWHAQHGRDCARMALSERIGKHGELLPQQVRARSLGGAPAFLYRELLIEAVAWLSHVTTAAPERLRFQHETRVIHLIHYIIQRYASRSTGEPASDPNEVQACFRRFVVKLTRRKPAHTNDGAIPPRGP
jgi:glucosyl-dolichyl phosphate glucuronosyltransferase